MKKLIAATVIFFIAVYFIIVHSFKDTQINKYPDVAAVKKDTAIQKGRVPAILPNSAYNIEETHDKDTNDTFGRFYYKKQDEEALMKNLRTVPDMNQTYTWGSFLFKVNKDRHEVKYRNKPDSGQ